MAAGFHGGARVVPQDSRRWPRDASHGRGIALRGCGTPVRGKRNTPHPYPFPRQPLLPAPPARTDGENHKVTLRFSRSP
jgi:hypothetical protein